MIYASLIVIVIYSIVVLYLAVCNVKIEDLKNSDNVNVSVSVLIPFRNEENNLPTIVECILRQNFPKENLEVLFINDHSTDKSVMYLEEVLKGKELNHRIIQLTEDSGKKAAVTMGVDLAENDLIIVTDADCSMSENWINAMVSSYLQQESVFLIGPLVLQSTKNDVLGWLQETEFEALLSITSATTNLNNPILCNAANLAFSKMVFLDINPYASNKKVASGDDIFFLQELKKHESYRYKIHFANNKEAVVKSNTEESIDGLIQQRVRWAAKGKYYTDKSTLSIAWIIFLTNTFLLVLLLATLFADITFSYFLSIFIIKWIVDYLLIRSSPNWMNSSKLLTKTFLLSLIYPFYTIIVAFLSLLYRPNWKGRKI